MHLDVPGVVSWRRAEGVQRAAAGADEGGSDVVGFQDVDDAVDGVAFGDATEIQLDAGLIEPDRVIGAVQDDVLVADLVLQLFDFGRRGQSAFAAEEAPRLHQRADGDVERAARLAAVSQRLRDEVEQLRVDLHGAGGRGPIELRERALRLVMAHQAVDAINFIERLLEDCRQALVVRGVRFDGVVAGHRNPVGLVMVKS